MKKIKIALAVILLLLIAALAGIWIMFGSIVKSSIESKGPELTGTDVTVNSVSIFPIGGGGSITGLAVANPDDFKTAHAFYFDKIALNLDPASIFDDTIVVNEITFINPQITVELCGLKSEGKARTNLGRIYDHLEARSDDEAKTSKGRKKMIIKKITLTDCEIHIASGKSSKPFKTLLVGDLEITGIGEKSKPLIVSEVMRQLCKSLLDASLEKVSQSQSVTGKIKEELLDLSEKAKKEAGKAMELLKEVWENSKKEYRENGADTEE